jgi:putative endonuclease
MRGYSLLISGPETLWRVTLVLVLKVQTVSSGFRTGSNFCERGANPLVRWLSKLIGDRGERAAVRFLRRQGYRILARNWQNKIGELDIIALDGKTLVFVEVKTRRSLKAGSPTEAITPTKQKQLTRAALSYLKKYKLLDKRTRFDVIAIIWPENSRKPEITHYQNAFEPPGEGQLYS